MSRIARPPQFSLATILLVTTLAAFCLAALSYNVCLGTAALVFALPSLARALFIGRSRQRMGEVIAIGEKVELFVVSLFVTGLALGTAALSFGVVMVLSEAAAAATFGTSPFPLLAGFFAGLVALAASLCTFLFILWRFTFPLDLR